MWKQLRTPIAVLLVPIAAFLVGKNLGYRDGVAVKYGGCGTYRNAIVEWQDMSERKVVLYLNSGADGYAFWFKMDPNFRHYSYAAKVFTCNNEDDQSIRECMDRARDWCKNEWDGGDTRILGGELKPRGDDDAVEADKGNVLSFSHEYIELVSGRAEIQQLKKDVQDLIVERSRLRKRLNIED
jgi:hypothetical protein